MITDTFDFSMNNLQIIEYWLVPIIAYISAFICFAVYKNHIYRNALRLSGISLLVIAVAWTLPLITEYIFLNLEMDDVTQGLIIDFNNVLSPVLHISGYVLLAVSFYNFKSSKRHAD